MFEWKTERRKVKDLLPATYNPRVMTEKDHHDLKESITRFNDVEPVVCNIGTRANVIIGGHQRVIIYADLGKEEIDVRVPNRELTISEETELNIRLNKNVAHWDDDKLREIDKGLLFDVGFDKFELSKLFDKEEAKDDAFDPDVILNQPEPKTKYGDVYKLGDHKLVCGDATKPEDFAKLMGDEKAQMIFTDPPYNVDYDGDKTGKIMNDKMAGFAFLEFLEKACKNMIDYCAGGIYICMSSSELHTLKNAFEHGGGALVYFHCLD